jgi:polyisoprenoid-binding protein YceI
VLIHADSYCPYKSFEEAIAKGFLGADKQPRITFTSTSFEPTGGTQGKLSGDLAIGGVTKPATFDVTITGSTPSHPFTKAPAIGVSAEGVIKRSDYGIAEQMGAILSDEVTISFDGEFAGPAPTAPPAP